MGNTSGKQPRDLGPELVALDIHHVAKEGIFEKNPKEFSIRLKDQAYAPNVYTAHYKGRGGRFLLKHMTLQRVIGQDGGASLQFDADPKWSSRNGSITGPGGEPLCILRVGSVIKFVHEGKSYRWNCKPTANWCMGFDDGATMKLMEMRGRDQVRTMASMHFTRAPRYGQAATLYLPLAAATDPAWQDLVVLTGTVALQHNLEAHRRAQSPASSAAASAGGGAAAAAGGC